MYKLYAVGFGTGDRAHMTAEAESAILDADLVVGYTTYVRLIFRKRNSSALPCGKKLIAASSPSKRREAEKPSLLFPAVTAVSTEWLAFCWNWQRHTMIWK